MLKSIYNSNLSIKFVNHASVIIQNDTIKLLTDPWYFGTAFHEGWSLIYENKDHKIQEILNYVTHIWISHEHPDHFSIPFFNRYNEILKKNKIKILFQKRKDKRVYNFINSQQLEIIELDNAKNYFLDKNFKIKCIKSSFFDSALIIKENNTIIFNLNDCPIHEKSEIRNFKKKYGTCDILLTQFSYAAWKGGKNNKQWRIDAANEKIEIIKNQSNILKAKITIPFASFIKFSNKNNNYLNDHVNTPDSVISQLKNEKFDLVFFKSYEEQSINNLEQKNESLIFWREKYNISINDKLISYKKNFSLEMLNESFKNYRTRVFKNNSYLLISILSLMPFIGAFKKIILRVNDLDQNITLNIFSKELTYTKNDYDIAMDSASLNYIFNNSFGFDTLTVNGCFEVGKPNGFNKMSKTLAIENLNNLGIYFGLFILFRIDIFFSFLKLMKKVSKKLKQVS